MTDAWNETIGLVADSVNRTQSECYEKPRQSSRLRPSAKHKASIRRLALRFGNVAQDRIAALEEDTADLPADMIEDICDRAARECKFFPTAAELRERAASRLKDQPEGEREQNLRAKLHAANTKLMLQNCPQRWIAPNGNWQMVDVISHYGALPKYRCNGAGGVEEAVFDYREKEWKWPDGERIRVANQEPMDRSETDRMNAYCAAHGISTRFKYDGSTYEA